MRLQSIGCPGSGFTHAMPALRVVCAGSCARRAHRGAQNASALGATEHRQVGIRTNCSIDT
eukprot:6553502-Alexandrium_andersonii.AAC.1